LMEIALNCHSYLLKVKLFESLRGSLAIYNF